MPSNCSPDCNPVIATAVRTAGAARLNVTSRFALVSPKVSPGVGAGAGAGCIGAGAGGSSLLEQPASARVNNTAATAGRRERMTFLLKMSCSTTRMRISDAALGRISRQDAKCAKKNSEISQSGPWRAWRLGENIFCRLDFSPTTNTRRSPRDPPDRSQAARSCCFPARARSDRRSIAPASATTTRCSMRSVPPSIGNQVACRLCDP